MAVILGINAFHADSAACLVVDGRLVAAIAEERLGERRKHCPRFPAHAVRRVLAEGGVRLRDVTHVAIARRPTANRGAKARWVLRHPWRGVRAARENWARRGRTAGGLERLAEVCDEDPARVSFETVPVEHHLAHIASGYYLSPFDGLTAGFSYDASGDFASVMAARCEGPRIEVLDRVTLPHSLGFFYTALCQLIGFDRFGEEYKVMGLAAYGEDRFADAMRLLLRLVPGGWFRLAEPFFGMHEGGQSGAEDEAGRPVLGRLYTERMTGLLGAERRREEPVGRREQDIARSTQRRFEQAARHCLERLARLVPGTSRLAMAGGCALNGVFNARIPRDTPFSESYIQPAASDDGTCLGAAFYVWHQVLGREQRFPMNHAYWGPEYPDERCRRVAESCGLPLDSLDRGELVPAVARLLAEGQVVGWYQGRSEWGPRALGNRSILADPARPGVQQLINDKIKRRESFRPFAPSVLRELVPEYFEQAIDSPFMMHVVPFRPRWRERLPGVVHVDGTGRLQSVARETNELYYDLIAEFRRRTGVGALLNTSFNENEPIVDTPEQALDCFLRTDLDALALGRHLLVKPAPAG